MPDDDSRDSVEQQPAQQRPNSEAADPPAPPYSPHGETAQQQPEKKVHRNTQDIEDRIKHAERWTIGLTIAIAFFALCSVIVGFLQWSAMRGQLREMKSGSEASINASRLDQRAWISTDKQIAVIGSLAEGSSIRSIERTTGVHRDTVMRLGVRVGKGCTALMDAKMRNLQCTRIEMDEIWGYIGKKERHLRPGDDPQFGNAWTFCAIDAETKLVPAFRVTKDREASSATAFALDVASRMKNRLQISTDGLGAYVEAIDLAFGGNVDYGQIIKTYGTEESVEAQRRYSAPKIATSEKKAILGRPEFDLISTSYVERLNATTRLHMKRLARLTHAFSKKRENFEAAVGLHFAYYNFVRRHNTLRCTPAMAAGVEQSFWSVGDLLEAAA